MSQAVGSAPPEAHTHPQAETPARSRTQSERVDPEAAFWRRHVRIGVTLFALGGIGVFVYALATSGAHHRPALLLIDILSVTVSLTVFRWIGLRLVATRWQDLFFFIWSAVTAIFIATAAALDGGTHSPLSYLLVLPLLFGGLAYKPKIVVLLAIVAVGCAAGIGFATPHPQASGTSVLMLATAIAGMLTIGGAINRARLNQRLLDLAALDSLTGCLAHRAFHNRVGEEVERARRYGRPFALVMIDVDNLKRLNDTAGHRAGDEALLSVSASLRFAARASDVVGRLGGDEFAVLLPETESVQLSVVLDRLHASLTEPSRAITTVSLGSTVWTGSTDSAEDMLRRADEALYAAKHAGRDRFVAWGPSIVQMQSPLSRPFDVAPQIVL